MRVPFEWLKEFVAVRLSAPALAERLTMAGLEVKGIEEDAACGPVFDIEVTPNRADCLSIVGIAREVAAMTGLRLKTPKARTASRRAEKRSAASPAIRVEDKAGCPLYIGRLIEGLSAGPSPDWMQRRLAACGARPINVLVDITNYVLFEQGQPLHAFDCDKLEGGAIEVRRSREGERITTLDGLERTLTGETLVIADAKRPVAVAGIMGGIGSEVTANTRRVLLESAYFEPKGVRRAGRRLGLASESSYRFERGVNAAGVAIASARAAELMLALGGGAEAGVRIIGKIKPAKTVISLDIDRMNRWLGTGVSSAQAGRHLGRLSCVVRAAGKKRALRVTPPEFRPDLAGPVDLYEEIARSIGYDRMPKTLTRLAARRVEAGSRHSALQAVRRACAGMGLVETMSWALVSEGDLAQFGMRTDQAARILNPLNADYAFLRPALVMGLARSVRRNLSHGASSVRLFELGSLVRPGEQPAEQPWLGVALAGDWTRDWRLRQPADFYALKGLLCALMDRRGAQESISWASADLAWAEPGQGTVIARAGRTIGCAGRLSRAIAKAMDMEQDVWLAELTADVLLAGAPAVAAVADPTLLPPVKRDLSVVVEQQIAYADVERVIREQGGSRLSRLALIDRYTGSSLPAGTYSLTFSLEYRDPHKTLSAQEADGIHQQVTAKLAQDCGARLR